MPVEFRNYTKEQIVFLTLASITAGTGLAVAIVMAITWGLS